jgi:hypothetical protein
MYAIRIRLLCAIINGETMQCDSQSLITASKDIICCVPTGLMPAVELFLLCQLASGGAIGIPGGAINIDTTLSTTDATITSAYEFVPIDNRVIRIEARALGYGGAANVNCGIGKIAVFKSIAGVVSQIGATAVIGTIEENAATDLILDVSGNTIRVRVQGIGPATPMNWRVSGQIFYEG